MNLLYIAQSCDPNNGSEDQIGWSIPWEASQNHHVHVITRADLRQSIESYLHQSEKRQITMHYVDIPDLYKKICKGPLYTIRLQRWNRQVMPLVKSICREHNIQVIHQITPVEFRSIGDYGRISDAKYVCGPIAGGQVVPKSMMLYMKGKERVVEYVRGIVNRVFLWKLKLNGRLKRCDVLLFANQETYRYLRAEKLGSLTYLYSDIGVDQVLVQAQTKEKQMSSVRKLLVAGRLIGIKGHDFLLDVLETLPDSLNYQCRIVGAGPLYEHLHERCQKPSLKEKISVVGAVPYMQMHKEYEWADALVFTSFREASGTVIIEAMAHGVPVIVANRCGAPVLLDSDSAWLYDVETLEQSKENLRQALIRCITSPEETEAKARVALCQAEQHTWKKKFEFYCSVYQELLSTSK